MSPETLIRRPPSLRTISSSRSRTSQLTKTGLRFSIFGTRRNVCRYFSNVALCCFTPTRSDMPCAGCSAVTVVSVGCVISVCTFGSLATHCVLGTLTKPTSSGFNLLISGRNISIISCASMSGVLSLLVLRYLFNKLILFILFSSEAVSWKFVGYARPFYVCRPSVY